MGDLTEAKLAVSQDVLKLAHSLAYSHAQEVITSSCISKDCDWFDLSTVEEMDKTEVEACVTYLELTDQIERHPANQEMVSILGEIAPAYGWASV